MHSPCQKVLECISRARDGGKTGDSIGMCARYRYSHESMPQSGAQLLAALPKDRQESGRTTDSQLPHLVLQRGSFYAVCRCGAARPGDHPACVVERPQCAFALHALEFWRPACVLRAAPWKLAISIQPAGLRRHKTLGPDAAPEWNRQAPSTLQREQAPDVG
jgi:hypothetical protein